MDKTKAMTRMKISKFDPETDEGPHFETYPVPLEGTVMDALRYIYENHDPSLSFRIGCAGAGYQRCGACALLVNGRPALSCRKLVEEGMTIEPHGKFKVIRDLAIDFGVERKRESKTVPSVRIIIDADKCDGCRDCVDLCPVKVLEVKKVNGSALCVPVDLESCCGLTCLQCAIFCRKSAIITEPIPGEEK